MMPAAFRALCLGPLAALALGFMIDTCNAAAAGAPAGDGGSSSGSSSGGNGGPHFPSAVAAPDPIPDTKPITRATETAISQCAEDDRICVADALDAYAAALRRLSPPLPPELSGLPDIVSRAAHRVRHAKTRAQATRAIKSAIAEVRKTISLLKADDPVVLKAETRQGAFVAETLAVAENKLEKASGL
jgi:hypothetical protein